MGRWRVRGSMGAPHTAKDQEVRRGGEGERQRKGGGGGQGRREGGREAGRTAGSVAETQVRPRRER